MYSFGLRYLSIVVILVFGAGGCKTSGPIQDVTPKAGQPSVPREFRAAWVATVANINWPSQPGLSVKSQKSEAIRLLDLLVQNNFNAVILQVRPQCDALYPSELEPWSYYLTGEQGKAPEPFYDPLQFWIEEAHNRGLELHAWLNPYRAHHKVGGPLTETSIVKKKPDLALALETGYWWLDPSLKGTQDHSYQVVMDIVDRYDVDGIHFDDYFYPYPSYNNNLDFPDDKSWDMYQQSGGTLSRGDWRRKSVNDFIQRLYTGIKKAKPFVKFGLSPFGIWRPNNPPSISGFDQYQELYADARLWLNQGWIDYWTPQLYWPINQIAQSYPVLLGWWKEENLLNRHLWPGMSIGRLPGKEGAHETTSQIMITRGMLPSSPGNVHWSIAPIIRNPEMAPALRTGPYRKAALVPPSPWLDDVDPLSPQVNANLASDSIMLSWTHSRYQEISKWVVYFRYRDSWDYQIVGPQKKSLRLPPFQVNRRALAANQPSEISRSDLFVPLVEVGVTAIDRAGNESIMGRTVLPQVGLDQAPTVESILKEGGAEKRAWGLPGIQY